MNSLIADMAEKIFMDLADPQTINAAKDDDWRNVLWDALEEMQLSRIWVPEELNGAGALPVEILGLATVAGRFALPVPLIETVLANWLLANAGLEGQEGRACVAQTVERKPLILDDEGGVNGMCRRIAFLDEVDWLAALAQRRDGRLVACSFDVDNLDAETEIGISGDSEGIVLMDGLVPDQCALLPVTFTPVSLRLAGAALRSAQIAGALDQALQNTVQYAMERKAFGREIGKFQVIQHNLAVFAGHVAAASAVSLSTSGVLEKISTQPDDALLAIASAKIRSGEAASKGAAIAHQVFGAMGFTKESTLHRYTHRMWTWRDDFGSEAEWALLVGSMATASGADGFWPMIVDGNRAEQLGRSR